METSGILRKIGLNDKEAVIYLALLENGPLTISGIAKASNLHRPAIYQLLPTLEKRGLVSISIKGKLKYYAAESPEKLKILVGNLNETLQAALPDLEAIYNSTGSRPVVKFFIGKDGIKNVFLDLVTSLKRGDIYYRYTSNKDLDKTEKYLPRDYRKIRDEKQLERYIINNVESAQQKSPNLNRTVKTMPPGFNPFDQEVSMLIYGDKIAFLDFNTETAITIENKKIAEFQKILFKFIYKSLD
jgi:HTH-type transcriptional regulator, sugar sensing transcriptional regulator